MEHTFIADRCALCGELVFNFFNFQDKKICIGCWNKHRDDDGKVNKELIAEKLKEVKK